MAVMKGLHHFCFIVTTAHLTLSGTLIILIGRTQGQTVFSEFLRPHPKSYYLYQQNTVT